MILGDTVFTLTYSDNPSKNLSTAFIGRTTRTVLFLIIASIFSVSPTYISELSCSYVVLTTMLPGLYSIVFPFY